jgi:hypothetical protein
MGVKKYNELVEKLANKWKNQYSKLGEEFAKDCTQNIVIVDDVTNKIADMLLTFKLFYDYDYKKAYQFAKDKHMHILWIPESEGANGNSYLVFKDTDCIPEYLKLYVIKNSNLWDQ